jgi:general secretion pathway protein D
LNARQALVLATAALLAGCAGQQSFEEGRQLVEAGQYVEGFQKVDAALAADPRNVQYRVYAVAQRQSVVNSLLARADSMRGLGKTAEAEELYGKALALDPKNTMARTGMDAITTEKRHLKQMEQAEGLFKQGMLKESEAIVRTVLIENPNQRGANALRTRIAEKRAAERRTDNKLSDAFRKPVSLDFRDAQLRSVFEVLSRTSGINFVFDKDVKADTKINISAKSTTVEDALKLMLLTNQLEQRVLNDNTVLIYPNTPQKSKEYQSLTVRSFYLANADVKQVSNTLKTILKTRDVVVNEKLNLIIIRDTPEAVLLAERLIALEDIGESEVMLEVEVLEIKRSRLQELGIKWPDQYSISVQQVGGTALSLFDLFNFNSARRDQYFGSIDVNAQASSNYLLNIKRDDGDTNLLANPRIRVRNKEKAKILIGDRVPVITTTSTSTGFVADSVNYVDVGLKLEVEPNITLDDEVSIKVALEVSAIAREITTRSGTLAYQIGTRNASTVLKLRDGETQVLAGLISDEDRKSSNRVPGIGQFPIIGKLFTNNRDDTTKTEIVLSITPRLIRTLRRPDQLQAEFDSGTEASLGGRALQIGGSATDAPPIAAPQPPPVRLPDGRPLPPRPGTSPSPSPSSSPSPSPSSSLSSPDAGVAVAAVTPSPPPPAAPTGPSFTAAWQGPASVRSGEQFTVTLSVQSAQGVSSMPVLVSVDPGVLQIVGVTEGDFMRQGGPTDFRPQIDVVSGRVFVSIDRQGEQLARGAGALLTLNLRAVRSASETGVQLIGVTPIPDPPGGVGQLPLTHRLVVE